MNKVALALAGFLTLVSFGAAAEGPVFNMDSYYSDSFVGETDGTVDDINFDFYTSPGGDLVDDGYAPEPEDNGDMDDSGYTGGDAGDSEPNPGE